MSIGGIPARRLDEDAAAPARRGEEPVAVPPGVAQVLALQRSAGNAAVGRMISARTLQRTKDEDVLVDFGERVLDVLDAIRAKPQKISSQKSALKKLLDRSTAKSVDAGHAPLQAMLTKLHEIAEGTRNASELPELVDPAKQGHIDALAATTMSARARDGAFEDPELQQRLLAEQEEHEGNKGEVIARVNLVVQALEKAYKAHQAQVQGGVRTIMVFLGAEWHFRHADGPFTLKERDLAIEKCRAVSAVYPDVVLMPGTILAYERKDKRKRFMEITNTAPVLWNGAVLKLIDKASPAGDTLGQTKETFKGDPGKGSAFFDLGELRFAIDICVDHNDQRAKLEGKEADVHLVTGAGQLATPGKTALGQHGYAIGADATGMGSTFHQEGTQGQLGTEVLEYGGTVGRPKDGTQKHRRLLDYMPPQPIGSAVPKAAIDPDRAKDFIDVNVADTTGGLTQVKVKV